MSELALLIIGSTVVFSAIGAILLLGPMYGFRVEIKKIEQDQECALRNDINKVLDNSRDEFLELVDGYYEAARKLSRRTSLEAKKLRAAKKISNGGPMQVTTTHILIFATPDTAGLIKEGRDKYEEQERKLREFCKKMVDEAAKKG